MARIDTFQGGRVQIQPGTGERVSAPDYGPGIAATALTAGAKGVGQVAEIVDQVEDVRATVEAQRLELDHLELEKQVAKRVRDARGEYAAGVAEQASKDLSTQTDEMLSKASDRARLKLEPVVRKRTLESIDRYDTYAHGQTVSAYDTNSQALMKRTFEEVADMEDEGEALAGFTRVEQIVRERSKFFGMGQDAADLQVAEQKSAFRVSRAKKLATTSATAARDYLTANRDEIDDGVFDQMLNAYEDEAMSEWAETYVAGSSPSSAPNEADPLLPTDEEPPVAPREEAPLDISKGYGVTSGLGNRSAPATGGGRRGSSNHKGLDLPYPAGTKVQAVLSGVVRTRNDPDGYGRYVVIDHGGGLETRYAHLQGFFVKDGTRVKKGDVIAASGNTGNSSGAHLHLEARQDGKPIDPRSIGKRMVSGSGTNRNVAGAYSPGMDLGAGMERIRSDPTLSPKQRKFALNALKGRYNEDQAIRGERESEAARAVTMEMIQLGDGFTSLKQLSPNLVASLSPSSLSSIISAANSNKEQKPLPLTLQASIAYTQQTNPTAFLDPKVQQRLLSQGVKPSQLGSLVQQAGAAQGQIDSAKPTPIPATELQRAAEIVFEAKGLPNPFKLDSDAKPGSDARQREVQEDAREQIALMGYLNAAARTWAVNNPGKVAGPEVVNGWIGHALRKSSVNPDRRLYNSSQKDIYESMSPAIRSSIIQSFKNKGITPSQGDIARAYREGVYLGVIR